MSPKRMGAKRLDWCELCGVEAEGIVGHHLSYKNEKVVYLCRSCHVLLHKFGKWTPEQIRKAVMWIEEYGHEWVNGTEKYRRSEYRRISKRESRRHYYREHEEIERKQALKWKKENPEANRKNALAWAKANPERWREINRQASKKYRDRKKEDHRERKGSGKGINGTNQNGPSARA